MPRTETVNLAAKPIPDRGGMRGHSSAPGVKHSRRANSPPVSAGGGSSISSTSHRTQECQDRDRKGPAAPLSRATTSRGGLGRGNGGKNQTVRPGAPMASTAGGVQDEDPWPSSDDGSNAATPAVKSEELVLSSGVVAGHGSAGGGGGFRRTHRGRETYQAVAHRRRRPPRTTLARRPPVRAAAAPPSVATGGVASDGEPSTLDVIVLGARGTRRDG